MSYTGQYGQPQQGQQGQYGQPTYGYGQQQQYGHQGMNTSYPPPPPISQQPENYGSTDSFIPKKGDRFKAKGYPDAWATILWIISLIGFGAVAAMSYKGLKDTLNGTTPTTGGSDTIDFKLNSADITFGISSVVLSGFGLTVVYFLLMQK
jgi:hypothetical protein